MTSNRFVRGGIVAANDVNEIGSPGSIGIASKDDDGDGVSNAQEEGSAGNPAGDLLGSNPLNNLSTPEVCDGIDNDLNEGIDEGFPDADGDGIRNCVDPDNDNDGIVDSVDPLPLNGANETFSDALPPFNGNTAGAILTRSGKTLTIVDATPNPGTGVQVTVSGAGSGSVQIQLEGKAETIALPSGVYVLTDPVSTSTVSVSAGGPAQITVVLNGLPVTIIVGAGAAITYTETPGSGGTLSGLSIDAVSGNVTFNFPYAFKNQGDCVSFVTTGGKPPKVTAPKNLKVEATSPAGAVVTFTASAVDPAYGTLPVLCTPASGLVFPIGTTTLSCSATNPLGNSDTDTAVVTVRDTTPPTIISVTPSMAVLPATDQVVPVSIAVVVQDVADSSPACLITKVAAGQKDLGKDGIIDWKITGALTLDIQAIARKKADRTYPITIACSDASGNTSKEKTAVIVSRLP